MTITELSIKRPILIIVFFLALALIGVYSYFQLNYELLPDITPPHVSIMTAYPGASPDEVETSLTKPIEDAAANVEKVKRVFSSSLEGASMVWVEFRQSANADEALQAVQRRVNEIADQLPSGARKPVLSKFSFSEWPILRIAATSSTNATDFFQVMKDRIRPRLAQLPGVGAVTLVGGEEREIRVLLNAKKMQARQLSVLQIVDMLRRSDIDIPAGKLKAGDSEYDVRLAGRVASLSALEDVTVGYGSDGARISLREVAEVVDGRKDDAILSRMNGAPSVSLLVQKQSDANSVEVSRLVRGELKLLEKEMKDVQVRFDVAQDLSEFTMESATAVVEDLGLAILLVACVMLVFLHSIRNAFIVLVAIPSSLIAVTGAMYLLEFTLNIMTLLAMSLVVGILVDDSIVVLENIYTHLQRGEERRGAALNGRQEIGFTAMAITLVDVVVFVPAALLGGVVGGLLRQFSLVVVIATLMSLLVSFTLTPMLASRLSRIEKLKTSSWLGRFAGWFERRFRQTLGLYELVLRWALGRRGIVVTAAGLLFVGALCLVGFGFIGSEFVTMADKGEFTLTLTLPPGSSLTTTDSVTRQIEGVLEKIPEVRKVLTNVGASNEGFLGMTSANNAEVIVSLVPKEERERSLQEIGNQVKDAALRHPGVKARIAPVGFMGTANDAPIQLLVSCTNRDSLRAAGEIVWDLMAGIPGASDLRMSVEEGRPETRIEIDRDKLALHGLTIEEVATALRMQFTGYTNLRYREGTTEYAMNVVLDQVDRSSTSQLASMSFVNRDGRNIELQQFARVSLSTGPGKLDRRNRMPAITFYSEAVGRPAGTIGDDIRTGLASTRLPDGATVGFEGDLEMQEEGFESILFALIAAILLVYLVMAGLYDSFLHPFVVLFSIPVALVGALLALALTMKTLNIFSFFGIAVMTGLVAKNAILLVDRTNQLRRQGIDLQEAVVQAGQHRLRPILMTTLTMVFGMMPIALATGAASEWKSGLAVVLIGGLTSSMFLTLLLVPTVYVDIERFKASIVRSARTMIGKRRADAVTTMLLLGGLVVGSCQVSQAQPRPLSISGAITVALGNNAGLRIASLEVRKAEETVRESWGAVLPSVTAEGTYTRYLKLPVIFFPSISIDPATGSFDFAEPSTPIEMGASNVYAASVSAGVPLYRPDAYAGIRVAGAMERMTRADERSARTDLVASVSTTYIQILLLREQRTVVEQSMARTEGTLSEARHLLQQGMATEVDTLHAYVALENQRPVLTKLDNAVRSSLSTLKVLLGLSADEDILLTDSLECIPCEKACDDQAYQTALEMRPDLERLQHQVCVAEARKDAEWAAHLPALVFFARVQVQEERNNFTFSEYQWPVTSMVGVQLSVPLFSGFRTEARVEQAELSRIQAETELAHAREAARTEILIAQGDRAEAARRMASSKSAVQAAERSYRMTRSRWQQGLCKQIEVADANVMLSQSRVDHLQAIADCRIAEVKLCRAIGILGK